MSFFGVAALGCWGALGVGRAVMFARRGVRVLVVDRERTWGQMVVNLAAAVCLVIWAHEIIAAAWPGVRLFNWPGEAISGGELRKGV